MRFIPALIIVLFVVTLAGEAKVSDFFIDSAKADSWYVQASLYEQDGEFEEAAKLLELVLESVQDEYVYLKLASIYQRLSDNEMTVFTLQRGIRDLPDSYVLIGALADRYKLVPETRKEALELYEKAYKLSGNSAYAESRAAVYAAMKDFNSAIKVYDDLLKTGEKSDWYVSRGMYYDRLGLLTESLNDYKKAAEIDGNFMAAAKLADHYVAEGNSTEAVRYLKMVLAQSPNLTIAKFRLAEILRKIGKTSEAKQYYNDILEFLNEDEKVYVLKQLAAISIGNKEFDKAEEYFSKAYEIDNDTKTAYSLALMAESAGDYELAEDWYKKVLENRSDFVEASKRLAILHLRKKENDKALAVLAAVEDMYQDVNFYRIKGQALVGKGDIKEAVKVLDAALKENPNEEKLYLDLALALDKDKRRKDAEDVIKKGIKLFPEDPSFKNFLGYMYAEQGIKLDEALKLVKAALDKKPEEPAYLDSLAWIYYQKGMYKEAYPVQKKALKGAPEEPEIREHMEAIIEKLGIKKSIDDVLKEN